MYFYISVLYQPPPWGLQQQRYTYRVIGLRRALKLPSACKFPDTTEQSL